MSLSLVERVGFPAIHVMHSPAKPPQMVLEEAQQRFNKGFYSSVLPIKLKAYNEAFALLKYPDSSEQCFLLFRLLERYAADIYFCPEKDQQGLLELSFNEETRFRRCACVMELSLCMQLIFLDFLSTSAVPDVGNVSSLEELVSSLDSKETSTSVCFDTIAPFDVDADVLAARAHARGLGEKMTSALTFLALSYQKIPNLCMISDRNLSLHRKLQTWTEALIGSQTQEQRQHLADYRFKRGEYMLTLQGASWEEKVAYYESLLHAVEECYPSHSCFLLKIKTQLYEIIGNIIVHQSGLPDPYETADPYLKKAEELACTIWRHKPLQVVKPL